jgi:hypothetical protein
MSVAVISFDSQKFRRPSLAQMRVGERKWDDDAHSSRPLGGGGALHRLRTSVLGSDNM